MSFSLIKDLVEKVEQFSKESPGAESLPDFAAWLHAQTAMQDVPVHHPALGPGETIESVIGKLVVYMNRYAKAYAKKAMQGLPISSADEFVFLIYLHLRGQAGKMELIQAVRMEKTTGMEILRRLAKAGFVESSPNEVDKRGKMLSLTPLGREALMAAYGPLGEVAGLIAGNLNEVEKRQLLRLLLKLEDFHEPLQHKLRKSDWKKLREEVQPTSPFFTNK